VRSSSAQITRDIYVPVKMIVSNCSGPRSSKEFTNLFAETSSGSRCLDLLRDCGLVQISVDTRAKTTENPLTETYHEQH
jgi:hypothetical protein